MNADQVLAWATLVVAVVSIVNTATVHYSEVDGPWYSKLLRTLLWLTERISILGSKGTDTILKAPLTDGKRPTAGISGSIDVVVAFVLSLVAAIVLAIVTSGCGSTLTSVDTAQRVVEASAPLAQVMCDPVEALCESRNESPCAALGVCLKARVIAARSLKSANAALQLAALAAVAGDKSEVDRWLTLASKAATEAQKQIALWRVDQ